MMQEAYTDFAQVYDTFMDNVDYTQWADQVETMIRKYGISAPSGSVKGESSLAQEKNLVVDLGCGTGTVTELLAAKGYDMFGIDLSEDMLNIALRRREQSGSRTMYLCQDMRDFELYGTAGTFISVGDSVNYLLSEGDIEAMFRRVNLFLYPGGIFVFDFKTLHLYRDVIGEKTIAEDREDCSFIWNNWYNEDTHINEYDLSIFVRTPSAGEDMFRKFEEVHQQRGYELSEMKELAQRAGLLWVDAVDSDTMGAVTDKTERILAVVRENGKDHRHT